MTRAVALGLRLAGGGAGSGRLRTAMVAAAAGIGTWLLLNVAAIARAEQVQMAGLYSSVMSQDILDGRTHADWVRPSLVLSGMCRGGESAGSAWPGRGRARG